MTLKSAHKKIRKPEKCARSDATRHFCTVDVNIWYFEGKGSLVAFGRRASQFQRVANNLW